MALPGLQEKHVSFAGGSFFDSELFVRTTFSFWRAREKERDAVVRTTPNPRYSTSGRRLWACLGDSTNRRWGWWKVGPWLSYLCPYLVRPDETLGGIISHPGLCSGFLGQGEGRGIYGTVYI